ncbi:MAG: hypothetical protein ACREUC_21000 [Steroidobacteraceae bacterium]
MTKRKETIMYSFKEQIIGLLDWVYLAMFMVWTVGITGTLVGTQFAAAPERQGVVEIYSLVPATDAQTGV